MRRPLLLSLLACLSFTAPAQSLQDFFGPFFELPVPTVREEKPFSLTGDLLLSWTFLNDEIRPEAPEGLVSGTMSGVRLTPLAGVKVDRGKAGTHRVFGGMDLFREFGGDPVHAGEFLLYYRYDNRFGKTDFSALAGCFPRLKAEGEYDRMIFSDEVRFYDPNLDGLLLRFRRPRSLYEICLDWNGMYGYDRREEFNVFTYGETALAPWLKLGWQGIFHHYANSDLAKGVVDDHLLHPWIAFDLASRTGLQALIFKTGPVLMYQRDRRFPDFDTPLGVNLTTDVRNWSFGIRNDFYYGGSMVPYYALPDATGALFASDLYMRSLKATPSAGDRPGVADILSFYWTPRIGEFVAIRVSCDLLFNRGYIGMDQLGTLVFDLDKVGRRSRSPRNTRPSRSRNREPQPFAL